MPADPPVATVVLLAGPSGCGKSRLADHSGLTVLKLDDFYRSGDEPGLPRLPHGETDWDHPRSWNAGAAQAALESLCRTGSAEVPVYDIAANGPSGSRKVTLDGARVFVAEGIFVAELVARCADRALLERAVCVRRSRWITFILRLFRDLREHRKSPLFLVRRGLLLAHREPEIVRGLLAAGCRPMSVAATAAYLGELRRAVPDRTGPPAG